MNREQNITSAAFTLIEMLAVMAMICILAGATVGGVTRARELARRTKAEAAMREMVSAWLQFFTVNQSWPTLVNGKAKISASREVLAPLIDATHSDNKHKLVLLNLTLPESANAYLDPWGTPYQLSFKNKAQDDVTRETKLTTSVSFPFRKR